MELSPHGLTSHKPIEHSEFVWLGDLIDLNQPFSALPLYWLTHLKDGVIWPLALKLFRGEPAIPRHD